MSEQPSHRPGDHDAFRAAVEARDQAAMVAALAPDVVFNSPIKHRPFEGREAVAVLFGALLQTFEEFRYTDEFEADGAKALNFRARVGEREVEGIDILRFDDEGLIAEFTVMVRPLTGAMALAEAVGEKLGIGAEPPSAGFGLSAAPGEG